MSMESTTRAEAVTGEKMTVVKTLAMKYTAARATSLWANDKSTSKVTAETMLERTPTIKPTSRMQPKHLHQ